MADVKGFIRGESVAIYLGGRKAIEEFNDFNPKSGGSQTFGIICAV
jgi:hypothetical protein